MSQKRDQIVEVTASTARALLRLRGETASRSLAELVVRRYESMTDEQKTGFFQLILSDFGADRDAVDAAITTYQQDPNEANTVSVSYTHLTLPTILLV